MALNTEEITAEQVLGRDSSHSLFNISLPRAIANIAQRIRDVWNRTTLDAIYPIGSVYISALDTHPTTLFGGQWDLVPNRFLVGAGGLYDGGEAGGDSAINMVFYNLGHRHTASYNAGSTASSLSSDQGLVNYYGSLDSTYHVEVVPPYLAVYIWIRVG